MLRKARGRAPRRLRLAKLRSLLALLLGLIGLGSLKRGRRSDCGVVARETRPTIHRHGNRSLRLRTWPVQPPRPLVRILARPSRAAHLSDGISANLQDATYVVGVLDWILAELVRIYSNVDAGATQAIIDDLVLREIPVIEEGMENTERRRLLVPSQDASH
jgi:hypothetical protein